ncbi:unnamed protein product, partial [Prorocentrum cordatum]
MSGLQAEQRGQELRAPGPSPSDLFATRVLAMVKAQRRDADLPGGGDLPASIPRRGLEPSSRLVFWQVGTDNGFIVSHYFRSSLWGVRVEVLAEEDDVDMSTADAADYARLLFLLDPKPLVKLIGEIMWPLAGVMHPLVLCIGSWCLHRTDMCHFSSRVEVLSGELIERCLRPLKTSKGERKHSSGK